ncbi:hypothetical protein EVAR_96190_1 [Eumeta japonica]|uniref:Uncharacterized protein n=1 Tax=Eumeta variegata TaxID=151549 RepID=A0A4C1VHJ6_EUMVA|nr:hypothetical protein EVAR_96190_1 [Eumeta japonica]
MTVPKIIAQLSVDNNVTEQLLCYRNYKIHDGNTSMADGQPDHVELLLMINLYPYNYSRVVGGQGFDHGILSSAVPAAMDHSLFGMKHSPTAMRSLDRQGGSAREQTPHFLGPVHG